jgi:steroid delta-isomerase-like uncharacterized protein
MSVETNKAVVRRIFEEAWNRGNLAVVDELIAVDAVDHHDPDVPSFAAHMKEEIIALRRAFPDLRFVIEDMLGEGDKVAVRLTVGGTHEGTYNGIPATGRRFAVEHIHIARVVDGKGVDHWAAMDTLGMLQQLGALPAPALAAR